MHPSDCPPWEYNDHQDSDAILTWEYVAIMSGLRKRELDTLQNALDSRDIHRRLFHQLTPAECPYYAGHYRGENFRCLKYRNVRIRGDRRVGYLAQQVSSYLRHLANDIQTTVDDFDARLVLPEAELSLTEKVKYAVAFVSRVFEFFLRIHPYVNGNGHAGRFIVWALLGRYGFWPVSYPVHPAPADPPYTASIIEYRNGNHEPLEKFILQCLDLQPN
jgi:fido (protein-threonine AMPylation protein)